MGGITLGTVFLLALFDGLYVHFSMTEKKVEAFLMTSTFFNQNILLLINGA
jgi:hypothetical protein